MICFDIETGPLPDTELVMLMPCEADIKFGNTKDPVKRQEKIDEVQLAFLERAALDALTGQVLAVGWLHDNGAVEIMTVGDDLAGPTERDLLRGFWTFAEANQGPLVGHNIHGFDLPFLVRRSWLKGVDVPTWVLVDGRFWSPKFVDLMKLWTIAAHGEFVKLDQLARALGLPGKPDGVTGADFHRLLALDRQAAVDYLRNDLQMTFGVASAMQLV